MQLTPAVQSAVYHALVGPHTLPCKLPLALQCIMSSDPVVMQCIITHSFFQYSAIAKKCPRNNNFGEIK